MYMMLCFDNFEDNLDSIKIVLLNTSKHTLDRLICYIDNYQNISDLISTGRSVWFGDSIWKHTREIDYDFLKDNQDGYKIKLGPYNNKLLSFYYPTKYGFKIYPDKTIYYLPFTTPNNIHDIKNTIDFRKIGSILFYLKFNKQYKGRVDFYFICYKESLFN